MNKKLGALTKVLDAYPPNVPGKRPICEGTLSAYTAESNERREEMHGKKGAYRSKRRARLNVPNDKCDFNARYLINGRWLCRKHAAYVVLDLLATRQEITREG